MAKLIIRQGGQEQVVDLTEATVTMGRSSEQNTIALRDIKASRQHCHVEKAAYGWKLVDLESSNGTSVNGQKVNTALLRNGDKINIGAVEVQFIDEHAATVDVPPDQVPAASKPAPEASPSETAIPVLISPPPAVEAPRPAPPVREFAPRKKNYVGMAVGIAAGFAALCVLRMLWNDLSLESSARDAYAAAAQLKDQGKVADAAKAYEKVLADYQGTGIETAAQRDLKQIRDAMSRWEEAKSELSHAKLLACVESDPMYVEMELSQLAARYADTPYAGEFQALIDRLKAEMVSRADDSFATAKARAGEAASRGVYGDALDEWKRFQANYAGLPICEKAEGEVSAILAAATKDWNGLVGKANDLALEGKFNDASKVYRENENRFRGTRYIAEVGRKVRVIEALASGRSSDELAQAEKRLAPHRGDLDSIALRADDLARQRLFTKALEAVTELDARLAEVKDDALKAEYGPRGRDIRDMAGLFGKLVARLHDGSFQNKKYNLAPEVMGEIADATDLYLDVKFSSGFARVNWVNVPAPQFLELAGRMGLESEDVYALAVFAWDNGLDRDGNITMQQYANRAKEAGKPRLFNSVARHRAIPEPSDGFTYFKERWLTLEEHKYALLDDKRDSICSRIKASDDGEMMKGLDEMATLLADATLRSDFVESCKKARIASLIDKKNQKIAEVKSLPAYMNFNKLKGLKQQLNAARDEAMKTIFDLKIYPDENHGIVGQPKVDEKVDAVEDLWKKPLAVVAKFDTNVELRINSVKKIQELLQKYEAPQVSASGSEGSNQDELESILAVINEQLNLKNVCLDSKETAILEYNKKVWAFNEKVESDIRGEERQVITLVNEYREMMGLRILEIEDHLVQAARKHSMDMEAKGYFAHDSLDGRGPGDRCREAGYKSMGVGENIAMGMSTPEEAHNGWYNSSGHHRNMLSPGWNQMGCGHSGVYWTEDFGAGTAQAR
ncbi:MAG: CAP domain-containing protein [Planctomycetota bacterium]